MTIWPFVTWITKKAKSVKFFFFKNRKSELDESFIYVLNPLPTKAINLASGVANRLDNLIRD